MPRKRRAAARRRTSVRKRFSRSTAKRGTKILGRSVKNIATGAILYEGVTRVLGRHTTQLGSMKLPADMILTGLAGEAFGGGQKDFISVGTKVGAKRMADRFILPRILGATNGSSSSRTQGGF